MREEYIDWSSKKAASIDCARAANESGSIPGIAGSAGVNGDKTGCGKPKACPECCACDGGQPSCPAENIGTMGTFGDKMGGSSRLKAWPDDVDPVTEPTVRDSRGGGESLSSSDESDSLRVDLDRRFGALRDGRALGAMASGGIGAPAWASWSICSSRRRRSRIRNVNKVRGMWNWREGTGNRNMSALRRQSGRKEAGGGPMARRTQQNPNTENVRHLTTSHSLKSGHVEGNASRKRASLAFEGKCYSSSSGKTQRETGPAVPLAFIIDAGIILAKCASTAALRRYSGPAQVRGRPPPQRKEGLRSTRSLIHFWQNVQRGPNGA